MPVVVNEFEVITEAPPASARGAEAPAAEPAGGGAAAAPDLARLLAEEHQRAERVRAS